MSDIAPVRNVVRVKFADLTPHPAQSKHFRPRPRHEIEELARDVQQRGLQNPILVLPDGTILAGHQRVEAARLLGWVEIDAHKRHDLAGDAAAAEETLVADNLFGRQMGPMDVARCYKALKELARQQGPGRPVEKGDLRDQIGRRLNVSGRNLDRYLRVLEHAPQEVQDAVSGGQLALTTAEKISRLPGAAREQVTREISQGDRPQDVATRHLARPPRKRRINDVMTGLLKHVGEARAGLEAAAGSVGAVRLCADLLPALQEAEELFRTLREHVSGDDELDEQMCGILAEVFAEEAGAGEEEEPAA